VSGVEERITQLQITDYKLQMRLESGFVGLQYLPGYSAGSFAMLRMTEREDKEGTIKVKVKVNVNGKTAVWYERKWEPRYSARSFDCAQDGGEGGAQFLITNSSFLI
jgi:hypothetical protein